MRVKFKVFRSTHTSWLDLFEQASDFASELGDQRLINISHACDHDDATVTVWYWQADASDS